MKFIPTSLPGVVIIEPQIFKDNRGFFLESYQARRFTENGIPETFVQHNHSKSSKDTLRGLHAQSRHPQGKLIRVLSGEIFDVVVDIRRGSPTYKKWLGLPLTAETFKMIYVPAGYAHGFYTLSETAEVEYKTTDYYDPSGELRILWNDPDLAIAWPGKHPVLSEKDRTASSLKQMEPQFPVYNSAK
jgi:dTDP-4-dehydrorhamnose 3,5-epimerase